MLYTKEIMVKKIQALSRQIGIVNVCLYAIDRILSKCSFSSKSVKYYFVAQKISDQPLLPPQRGNNIFVTETIEEYENNPCPRPISVIKNRYKQGAKCLSAYKDEEFAGCLWYIKGKYKEDEVNCLYELPAKNSVWDFDVYVEPKFRLSPVFLKLWDYTSDKLLKENCLWSLSRISAFNPNSLFSHKRMGAVIIGWAVFVCLGAVQVTVANVSPFFHISFGKASFPVFRLEPPK